MSEGQEYPYDPWEEEGDEPAADAVGSPRPQPDASEMFAAPGVSEQMLRLLEALTDRLAPPPKPAEPREEKEPVPPQFPNAVVWFRDWCRQVYRRGLGGVGTAPAWAEDWWAYPEARARIDAIWRAWEHLRMDPATGMSVWFRDHGDPHMAQLLGENGPFVKSNKRTKLGEPLPHVDPPEALLEDER